MKNRSAGDFFNSHRILRQPSQGQETEYTDRILYGPGSQSLNAPFLIFLSASSKEANKQWAFV